MKVFKGLVLSFSALVKGSEDCTNEQQAWFHDEQKKNKQPANSKDLQCKCFRGNEPGSPSCPDVLDDAYKEATRAKKNFSTVAMRYVEKFCPCNSGESTCKIHSAERTCKSVFSETEELKKLKEDIARVEAEIEEQKKTLRQCDDRVRVKCTEEKGLAQQSLDNAVVGSEFMDIAIALLDKKLDDNINNRREQNKDNSDVFIHKIKGLLHDVEQAHSTSMMNLVVAFLQASSDREFGVLQLYNTDEIAWAAEAATSEEEAALKSAAAKARVKAAQTKLVHLTDEASKQFVDKMTQWLQGVIDKAGNGLLLAGVADFSTDGVDAGSVLDLVRAYLKFADDPDSATDDVGQVEAAKKG